MIQSWPIFHNRFVSLHVSKIFKSYSDFIKENMNQCNVNMQGTTIWCSGDISFGIDLSLTGPKFSKPCICISDGPRNDNTHTEIILTHLEYLILNYRFRQLIWAVKSNTKLQSKLNEELKLAQSQSVEAERSLQYLKRRSNDHST